MKSVILKKLKEFIFDFLIKTLLGAAVGGVKGAALKLAWDKLWKKVIQPRVLKAWRLGKKADKTVTADTRDEHDKAIDDLFE